MCKVLCCVDFYVIMTLRPHSILTDFKVYINDLLPSPWMLEMGLMQVIFVLGYRSQKVFNLLRHDVEVKQPNIVFFLYHLLIDWIYLP